MSEKQNKANKNIGEDKFKNHFKASILLALLSVISMSSLLVYFASWVKISFLVEFFSGTTTPLDFLLVFFNFYWLTFKEMIRASLISFLIIIIAGVWGILSIHRYLYLNKRNSVVAIIAYLLSWFLFVSLPFISYIPVFCFWLIIYYWCIEEKPVISENGQNKGDK